jgi:hypothetical protein
MQSRKWDAKTKVIGATNFWRMLLRPRSTAGVLIRLGLKACPSRATTAVSPLLWPSWRSAARRGFTSLLPATVLQRAMPIPSAWVTALNLAVVMARDFGKKTLLLEGDFKAPSISRYLKVDLESSLIDLIASHTDIRSTAIAVADTLIPLPKITWRCYRCSKGLKIPRVS